MRRNYILILCVALVCAVPLLVRGPSCGHDFDFHLQSWIEAASQLRHGTLLPHWAFSAAWNAGEPRFIFYPPLSWMLGSWISLIFPIAIVPAVYTSIALAAAGLAMHRLASYFAEPLPALIAAVLYMVNPYMLFTAYERTAYAELLAAAWLPLLLLAALRAKPSVQGISLPLALLWLTNAPAAVMGSYTLALVITLRLAFDLFGGVRAPSTSRWTAPARLAVTATAGTVLGLALPAFYLVPAAYERRFVQIAMAIIPNMRFQDNFLFGHTADAAHNVVLHTASVIAVALLIATALVLVPLLYSLRPQSEGQSEETRSFLAPTLAALTGTIAFLLTPASTFLWNHLPNLAFLQFPWRLLAVLTVALALALAILLRGRQLDPLRTLTLLPVVVVLSTWIGIHQLRQRCYLEDLPGTRVQLFATHHGVAPTDEYTPAMADNDTLRANDPGYWIASDPAAFAPRTTPNPAAAKPNYDSSNPPDDTLSAQAPRHATIHADGPGFLILNLRDYPNWDVTLADPSSMNTLRPPHIPRDDGLIALPLYAGGDYGLNISWRRSLDQQLGLALSLVAAGIYAGLITRQQSRRIEV